MNCIAGALFPYRGQQKSTRILPGILFSAPVEISDGSRNRYALGLVSVMPALQGQDIGRFLVKAGLYALHAVKARYMCFDRGSCFL